MKNLRCLLGAFILAVSALSSQAAGVIPFALTQQINVNGLPLANCKLYTYVVGTTATPQNMFSDFGLTQQLPNPISCDQTGRLPNFYLADGQVHVRLTDSGGVTVVDIPVIQVIGPSSGGGGGGGGGVDPNAIASTGDTKWRPTSEVLPGWVVLNATTIGSATSGATGRANADTQTLYVYLWNNCPDAHCPVSTGRGSSGLADFTANKQLTLFDMRSRTPVGLDQMGAAAPAGRLLASNVTSGGGDGVNTPNATGGEANHTLLTAELAQHLHVNTLTEGLHTHNISGSTAGESATHTHGMGFQSGDDSPDHTHNYGSATVGGPSGGGSLIAAGTNNVSSGASVRHQHTISGTTNANNSGHSHSMNFASAAASFSVATAITNANAGSNTPHNVMNPFMLGTWWIKL